MSADCSVSQEFAGSIPGSGIFFHLSTCQLLVKGVALSTGCLLRLSLPRKSVDGIIDHLDMTSAIYS